ncbi:tetratricopeptide repeat protein [Novipirellula artificiosorum]|uniref:Tetratricopeptide repeat protein n=1 Tax=Novipirellula artificiosorum TaxID=2528016 RepID=A0A5C6DVY4_9BACT|nr:tetratricopeptide repeat protein [Novipirellula artificiosorum]TWU40515.1 tetratricopeptide repeat protein [Novipirellula artificiosorum]
MKLQLMVLPRSFRTAALWCVSGWFLISEMALPTALAQQTSTEGGTATTQSETQPVDPKPADTYTPDPGQADFDEAVLARIDAETPAELEAVSTLLESALAKGLNEENTAFAKKILGSVLLQRSQQLAAVMARVRGRRQIQLRDEALEVLDDAVENDPTLVEAFLLIARLNLVLDENPEKVVEAATKAIELLEDDPVQQSGAYLLRAIKQDSDQERMDDLNKAIEIDPTNVEALQARAALRMQQDDVDGAIADMEQILTEQPGNQILAQAVVQELVDRKRMDDAMALVTKSLEAKPSEGMYRIRGFLYRMQGKDEQAVADFNKALAMQPKDPISMLQRAEIALSRGDIKAAKEDMRAAIRINPSVAEADATIFVRCLIAVEEGRMADAINDMKLLAGRDPSSVDRQLQLATLYSRDERPRKAIEVLNGVLDRDPNNASVLRSRADALLSVGEHAEAIADYERAIDHAEDSNVDLPGILNNLAWVLATSPNDEVRNGKRSVELGQQAAELTEYKEAHILSTLAAGYAETGDFEKAIEWSSKAVELGEAEENPQTEQLKEELESYRENKAWREQQEVEENEVPILEPDDLIDT